MDSSKILLYTCLGENPSYLQVFSFLMRSLMCHHHSPPCFDFLIIVDENLYAHVQKWISDVHFPFSIFLHQADTQSHAAYQDNNMAPSYLKLHLFDWPRVFSYDTALFIDADIIVPPHFDMRDFIVSQACNPEKLEDGCLYAMREFEDMCMHRMHYFDLHDYTDEEIAAFEEEGIYAFNTGLFSFKVNADIKRIFSDILEMIHTTPDPRLFFYEQSFMNVYLNRTRRARYDVITHDHCELFVRPESAFVPKLLHFCGEASNGKSKGDFMHAFCSRNCPEILQHVGDQNKEENAS